MRRRKNSTSKHKCPKLLLKTPKILCQTQISHVKHKNPLFNQFDNRKCNLIDVDNKAKHEKLHAIMTEEFPEFYFSNVIDI